MTVNKSGKFLRGSEKFYCAISGAGIDPKVGRKDIPKDFVISPDSIDASTKTVPKFRF